MPGTVTCRSCGKEVAAGDRFCASCGTVVTIAEATVIAPPPHDVGTNPTQCITCGAAMGREDKFCPQCGASRPEAATVVSHVSLRNAQAIRLIEATKGEFEILEQLGTGAMGSVYLAKDIALSRKVAIKVIAAHLLSDETMISRFRMEAQTVASLRHPNIVNVHAVRQSSDLHFFVMEFIDGPPLRNLVKQNAPLDVEVVQTIMFQVGSALSYAHRSRGGVIHRDVKPANIMVDREGDAFVTDFGISKIAEAQTGLTQTGATIGTPEYMSPEQCRGDALTGASDQYALGVVAYEMLCGHTPFSGSQYHIMVAHTTEQPKPIQDLRPDCPPHVAEAVERMLAKAADDRWPDLDSAVMAMGGASLGYHDPIRQKIKALTGATLMHIPAVGTGSRSGASGGRGSLDTATSVTVLGIPSVLETGERVQLRADVRGTGNTSLGGLGVTWASTDASIAKVEGGWVEGIRPGSVSIMATAGNVASSVLLTVAEPAPAKVLVRPGSVRMHRGGKIGLSAQIQDKRGRPLEREIRWLSSDAAIATVSATGEVVASGSGPVTITAESEGATGTAEIVVEAPVAAPPPVKPAAPAPKAAERATPGPSAERAMPSAAPPEAPAKTPERPPSPGVAPGAPAAKPAARTHDAGSATSKTEDAKPKPEVAKAKPEVAKPKPAEPKPPAAKPRAASAPAAASATGSGAARPAYRHPAAIAAALVALVGVGVFGVRSIGGGDGGGDGGADATPPAVGQGAAGSGPGGAEPSSPPAGTQQPPGPAAAGGASGAGGLSAGGPEPGAPADGTAPAAIAGAPAPPTVPATTPPSQTVAGGDGTAQPPAGRQTQPAAGRGQPAPAAGGAAPAATPTRVTIAVPSASMPVGGSQSAVAQVFAAGGAPMGRGSYALSWRSSDASVLSVNAQSGAIQATAPGSAWIVGTAGSARDSVRVSVAAVVTAVQIAQQDFTVESGAPPRELDASVLDQARQPVQRTVTWSSSNDRVATVDAAGRVTPVAPGSAQITASAEGFSDQVTVSVTASTPALPSAEQARGAVAAYVAALAARDRDLVTRLWGSGDPQRRDQVLELFGENNFTATLRDVGTPSPAGDAATLTFQVAAAWRTNFGQNRGRDLTFTARLERVGGQWQIGAAAAQ
jgi:uncharacterized protein YjdB/tRNA A-37 threonylcarbamoyl transferase component Bud32